MRYPVVVHKDKNSVYGVTVPDIPGCFSAGESFDEALSNTIEAIEAHLELMAEEKLSLPQATCIENHNNNTDYKNGTWGFVDINIMPFLGKGEKINVTLPSLLIHKIEKAGIKNRSAFLTEAALQTLEKMSANHL